MNVVFDFDGVINSYVSGWTGEDNIVDPPVPGIKEAIDEIRKAGYKVIVCSSRCSTAKGNDAIIRYLMHHNIKVDGIMAEKPPAIVYIDDRAICFNGHPESLLDKINNFKPWNHEPNFYKCTVFGEECIFTTDRIEWDRYGTLNLYELRADSEGEISAIETRVKCNFSGTILSKVKLIENREEYYVRNGEYGTQLGDNELIMTMDEITMKEFLKKEGEDINE